jgi:Fe2+ or Zn2+ uptake regulation protein
VPDAADPARVLRAAGPRVARPRLTMLDAVHVHPHVDTGTLFGATRVREVSHQAGYDVLTDSGLVRRIQPRGSVARYEARVGDDHGHLVCRSCGAIADVDCATGVAPRLTPCDDGGLVIDDAEVHWGRCPSGAAGQPPASPDRPAAQRGTP